MKFSITPMSMALIIGAFALGIWIANSAVLAHPRGEGALGCAPVHSSGEAAHYFFQKWDYRAAGNTDMPYPLPEWDFYGEQTIDEWVSANKIDPEVWRRAVRSVSVHAAIYDAGLDEYVLANTDSTGLHRADGSFGVGLYLFPTDHAHRYLTSNIRACVKIMGPRATATPTATPSPTPTATPES